MQYRNILSVISACSLMVMQVAADGHIITFSLVEEPAILEGSTKKESGNGSQTQLDATRSVVLTVDTVPGNEYRIQAAGSLVSGNWDDIGEVFTATESRTTLSFPENDSHRFFRVIPLTQSAAPSGPTPPGPPPSVPHSAPPL